MKSEDIYKALGKADDDLLERSESGTESLKNSASRRRKKIKRVLLAACFALLLTAAVTSAVLFGKNNGAFTAGPRPKDLAEAYYLESSDGSDSYLPNGEFSDAVTSFGICLFAGAYSESENTLLSPVSAASALAMCRNGAVGGTADEISAAFSNLSAEEINSGFSAFMKSSSDAGSLRLANSVWLRDDGDRLSVEVSFLYECANSYGAQVYAEPFDKTTLKKINRWVEEKTDKMIKDILDGVGDDSIMYILNATAFSADWEDEFLTANTHEKRFTNIDGSTSAVQMMNGSADCYMENENCTGFAKMYKGENYYFAALLPNGDISKFVKGLGTKDGAEEVMGLLKSKEYRFTSVTVPKFSAEYAADLIPPLSSMGIKSAFDPAAADFSGMAKSNEGNVFIGRVTQKSRIDVTEKGTKAASATLVDVMDSAARDEKRVTLDRPFIYMIVDAATDIPVFIGAVNSVS